MFKKILYSLESNFMHLLYLLFITALISACSIDKLKPLTDDPYFIEKIGGFYVLKNKNLLAGIGRQHTYIFEIDDELVTILDISKKITLTPTYSKFNVNSDKVVSGSLTIYANNEEVSEHDAGKLKALNFIRTNNDPLFLKYKVNLLGTMNETAESVQEIMNFEQPYEVKVITGGSEFKKAVYDVNPDALIVLILAEIVLGAAFEHLGPDTNSH